MLTLIEEFKNADWNMKLVFLRILRGWTQEEAAQKIGTTQKNVWKWEAKKSTPRNMSKKAIAFAYGVQVDEIFGE